MTYDGKGGFNDAATKKPAFYLNEVALAVLLFNEKGLAKWTFANPGFGNSVWFNNQIVLNNGTGNWFSPKGNYISEKDQELLNSRSKNGFSQIYSLDQNCSTPGIFSSIKFNNFNYITDGTGGYYFKNNSKPAHLELDVVAWLNGLFSSGGSGGNFAMQSGNGAKIGSTTFSQGGMSKGGISNTTSTTTTTFTSTNFKTGGMDGLSDMEKG